MAARGNVHNLYKKPKAGGGFVWYVDFYQGNRRVRRSLKTNVLKLAKERRDVVLAGREDSVWTKGRIDTDAGEFWDKYLDYCKRHKSPNSWKAEVSNWKQLVAFAKPKKLGDVTVSLVEDFARHLRDDVGQAPRSINNNISRLLTIYNRAIDWGDYSGPNPFKPFKRLPVEQLPPRYLTDHEMQHVLDEASQISRDIYFFCALGIYSGMRTAEAGAARWEWFDFDQQTITIQGDLAGEFRTKSSTFRTVPLHDRLRAILEPLRTDSGYLIMPNKTEQGAWRVRYEPRRAFRSAIKAAGVPWATPHVLRHTFASGLVRKGVSLYKVSRWLGHSSINVTQRYAHLPSGDEDINRL